jgi:WD40 repeat protein
MSYRGDVALWDSEFGLLDHTSAGEKIVRHGSISPDKSLIASCAEFGVYNGIVSIWDISDNQLTPVYIIRGNYRFPEFSLTNKLFVLRESPIEERAGVGK